MPGETKEVPAAGTETLTPTKAKHQTSKAALARVTLLDGSILDVTIDRKAKGRDLISSICAGLNIQEKEYFGLIYATPVDPRVWLDLDKLVSKFFKTDPWVLQFAVKFYPPEPAQLKEDITRYQLCLQVRNDILEGRLPCSFVTHALLGSYLVQSEMGDYDPKEMPDRSYLKDFKIAPNQSPDLEDKVMDLHKSHRGQSPAEAELHYLENAKKLALYGVDLHPAKDSEGVDIMLGVCSAGIFVHRDKLRINRFAWPKILKISYKRHHFYVKIRPGEFEQYESTIGFKLANHRAAKKLWKSCVEHHTFFRLMTPEQPNKAGLFPRFGSKYRYTGPTMAESRNNTLSRDQPRFDRTLSGRGLPTRSMDGIVQAEKKKNDPKRQSLPPDSIADPIRSRSPLKNDKKEKESPEKDKKPKGVNGTEENGDKSPGRGRGGIFGSGRKSPKKDKSKEKEPVAVAVTDDRTPSPDKSKGHTRPYEYSESELDVSPTRRSYNVGGFSYDKPNDGNRGSVTNGNDGQLSPNSRNKKIGLAFNYAPEDAKLKEHADKILYGQLSPKTKDKLAKGQLSPKSREKLLKEGNLSPKTRRLLSGDGLPAKDGKSYSPSSPSVEFASGAPGKYTPIDGAGTKVVPGVAMGGGKPKKKQVKIMLIVSKFDPKTKAIDTENGHVEHLTGLMDTETGLIDTKYGQIDPKKATLESYNPETNKVELFKGELDGKTGNLHFTSGGVVDPRTGKVDNTLGEIVSIVPEENPVVELTCITSRIDPKTKKIDTVNGDLEYSPAVLDIENQVLHTKYGQIHLKTGELKVVDPKTGKVISSSKNVTLDPVTQQIIINGVVDPKTGKLDPTQGRLIEVGQQIDPLVEVSTISGKLDSKKNTIDPKIADFEKSTGQHNPKTGKVDTKYGQLDLVKQTLTSIDPKTGKSVVKDVKIDPVSGQVVLKNQINPKTGKHDKDYGRIMSLKIITTRLDPVTKKPILSPEDAIVDPVTNQIWTPTGAVDPITKEKQYVSSTVDPKTGTIITIYGYLNPKTNEIRKQTKIDGNLVKVDPDTGKIFTATGETDKNGEPLFATTEFDPATGEVYTKVGKVDPKTKKIVLVKILLLSKPDPTTGRPQEVDPDTCDIDPTTGRVTKFFNKTVYVYNMVDPITGDIIQVDPNDPRIAGAKTTVTQTMTLSGEVDPKTGRIKTEWGHIDPKTGDIDPKTAVKDPVTGKLILNYAQIDPSHFGKDKIRRSSIASSDDDEMAEYSLEQTPQKQTAPTVVQTTTKQTITKTDDGVTHNVQEEIRNLGTGQVTISTQEHKVSPTKEQTPKRISEPVVTAAVAKPSKQSHDFTSAFLEGERYNKEPAYASPEKKATTTTTETVTKVASPPSPTKTVTSAKAVASPTVPEFASASTAFVPEPLADVVKEKPVKVLSIISKVDPKTKRIDIENGKVEQIEAKLNPTTGLIKTKYGTLNPAKGTLENIATKEVVQGTIDPKTGTIQFTNDPAHGQILSVVPNDKTFVELTVVSSKFEPNTKNINPLAEDAQLEKCVGVLDIENGTLDTKYGQLCTKTGEIRTIDPKTGKVHVTKNAIVTDPSSGQIKIVGLPDPKTGKVDDTQGCLIEIGQQIDPVVEVISVAGKMDKKGIIDPKTTTVETTVGQYNPETGRINTKYGQLDLVKNTITSNDPKNNKPVAKDVKIDPVSGQITMKNIVNPKNNKVEKDFGRILNVKIVPKDDSHKTGAIVLDSKTNQLWKPTGIVDKQYVSSKVDPKTGQIILVYGYLDPKTNEVQPITKMDDNIVKVDSKTGKLYTIIEESDKNGEPLYATTYVDQESGEVYTKVGKYDPVTKTIVLVKIYLISKIDPATGKPQLIDPNSCTVDPVSGRVTKFFNKTVYVYNMVDPITGEIIQVDPNDPRVAGAKTTVVQTLTLTGEIDPVTGRIKTEYGHIDPNTGDIDPATAVKDPVTGKLILNYAEIDPSHFGKEVTVTKETVPISRDEFFEGIKKIEKNTGTVAAAGSVPTVVKTTTKQVITKTDDGVTHNLEEEVRNLGTGEVTYSTQEHKADASGNDTSGAYLQATAVTTRTATTHEDLGKKARTEQLEEKTVGTTRTYDPTKQEQRVVTQEVKTTVTATSGDQYTRRDSISSTSSGDSGTPIDGLDESYTVTSSTYKPSEQASVKPSGVVLGETSTGISGGEIVSSQTVSSKTRTVETITYKTERDGIVETRVEQKITIQSDGDPIDHDKALAEAIQEATAMNPDMTVEKIEIQQQTQ